MYQQIFSHASAQVLILPVVALICFCAAFGVQFLLAGMTSRKTIEARASLPLEEDLRNE